jgi:hypothetical protein
VTTEARRDALPPAAAGAPVLDFARRHIERALARRARYRYVRPRVVAESGGWKVVSPNCSRRVDPQGGEIPIALFAPGGGGWHLYARDHDAQRWVPVLQERRLSEALAHLLADPAREFWQ